jgi:hypothetical protein
MHRLGGRRNCKSKQDKGQAAPHVNIVPERSEGRLSAALPR